LTSRTDVVLSIVFEA